MSAHSSSVSSINMLAILLLLSHTHFHVIWASGDGETSQGIHYSPVWWGSWHGNLPRQKSLIFDSLSCSQWQKNKHHKLYLTHKEWINPFFKCFFSSLIKSLGQQMSFLRWLTNLAYWDISFRLRFWSVVSLQLYETLKICIAGEDKVIRLFVVWITNTIMCHHIWELGHQVMQPWDQPLFFGGVLSNTKVFAVLHNFWLTTFSNPSDF